MQVTLCFGNNGFINSCCSREGISKGSIILQAILGFIAAAAATASFYWNKVKLFFAKLFKKDQNEKRE